MAIPTVISVDDKTATLMVGETAIMIDAEELPRVMAHSWRIRTNDHGQKRIFTSIKVDRKWKQITLGSFLFQAPQKKATYVYRKVNSEVLDYRRENLFVGDLKSCKQIAPPYRTDKTSKFKGVSFCQNSKLWRAAISVNYKSIFLGFFEEEEAAARAYDQAARDLFGSHAYMNFQDPSPKIV